jgi:hypothetical protein
MVKPAYLLTAPLAGVMVSGLSRAEHDPAMHTAVAARLFRLVGIGLFPCAAGLTVVGPDVMTVLGSGRWREAGLILSALAPALVAQGCFSLTSYVLSSAGKSRRLLVLVLVMCLLVALGGWAGIHLGKTHLARFIADPVVVADPIIAAALGLAIAYSLVMLAVWCLPLAWFSLTSIGIRPGGVLRGLWPALVAAVLMGLAVWGLSLLPVVQSLAPWLRLVVLVSAGVAVYGILAYREPAWFTRELILHEPLAPSP